MRRRHARVRRVKLIGPAAALEFGRDFIDPLRHDEHGAVDRFRQEVAERPLQAARENHALAFLRDKRERAVDSQNDGRI